MQDDKINEISRLIKKYEGNPIIQKKLAALIIRIKIKEQIRPYINNIKKHLTNLNSKIK